MPSRLDHRRRRRKPPSGQAAAMRKRDALVAAGVAVLLSAALSSPIFETLQGLSIDSLFWLRYKFFGQMHDPTSSPTVVIALDEETWRSVEFNSDPEVLWLPRI